MPARVGRREFWHDTDRFGRELHRPARVLAGIEAVQRESGPVDRAAVMATSGDLALGCMPGDDPRWHAFARITLKLSGKRIK